MFISRARDGGTRLSAYHRRAWPLRLYRSAPRDQWLLGQWAAAAAHRAGSPLRHVRLQQSLRRARRTGPPSAPARPARLPGTRRRPSLPPLCRYNYHCAQWTADLEPNESAAARAYDVLIDLARRRETYIGVVAHGGLFHLLLNKHPKARRLARRPMPARLLNSCASGARAQPQVHADRETRRRFANGACRRPIAARLPSRGPALILRRDFGVILVRIHDVLNLRVRRVPRVHDAMARRGAANDRALRGHRRRQAVSRQPSGAPRRCGPALPSTHVCAYVCCAGGTRLLAVHYATA